MTISAAADGRGSAQVGDKIADGEIGFMADGGDDGNPAGGDGARQGLIVEGGKVFDAASAARDDDDIDAAELVLAPATRSAR